MTAFLRFLTNHARGVLANARSPVPWPHMLICGSATSLPILVGLLHGEAAHAVYGALAGYFVSLNDHFGGLKHRLLVSAISFAALTAAFALGLNLHPHPTLYLVAVGTLTYALGLMGGLGAEIERLLLFSVIDLVVVNHTPAITPAIGQTSFIYGLVAVLAVAAGQILSDRLAARYRNPEYARLRPSVVSAITGDGARHRYARDYALAVILAETLVARYGLERGYWTVITVLLVMRPNLKDGLYRLSQRLFGTLLGVAAGDALVMLVGPRAWLVLGVAAAAFAVPYGVKRNYWLVSFFATILVVLFLTLPGRSGVGPETHVPFVRLVATLYGCALSAAVSITSALTSAGRRRLGRGSGAAAVIGTFIAMAATVRAGAAEFDVYRPARTGPLVIFVHGGAWISGSRAQYGGLGRALAAQGLCVAVIDYRLAPGAPHPAPLEDLEAARLKLTRARDKLCDHRRLVLVGHSAGAHAIAAWAARYPPVGGRGARGFVGLEGIYDLPKLAARFPTYADWFLTKAFGPAAKWPAASPSRSRPLIKAPWLVVHASGDELVDAEQANAFAKHVGAAAERFTVEGSDHAGVLDELATRGRPLNLRALGFIRRVAGKGI